MQKTKVITITYWLTCCAFLVSLICWWLFSEMERSSGDYGIALWAVFLVVFIFVSVPLHLAVLVLALIEVGSGNRAKVRWVCTYLVVSFVAHLVFATQHGAFDDYLEKVAEEKREAEFPAQVALENAFKQGNRIDISTIRDALYQGADPNAGPSQSSLPFLVRAAWRADRELILLLLNAGADPNIQAPVEYILMHQVSLINATALDVIGFSEKSDIYPAIDILINAGADPSESLLTLAACKKGNLKLYQKALELGANGLIDANKKTCLHHVAESNHVAFLRSIFSASSATTQGLTEQLFKANAFGQFPLDVALTHKYYELAILLLERGATANKKRLVKRVLEKDNREPHIAELKQHLLNLQIVDPLP